MSFTAETKKLLFQHLSSSTNRSVINGLRQSQETRVRTCTSLIRNVSSFTTTPPPYSSTSTTSSANSTTMDNSITVMAKPQTEAPRAIHLDTIQSTSPYHFYENEIIEKYASQPVNASTLRQFIFFGRQMNTDRLLKSGNWVRDELLVRLAHRIRDFQQLPFFVGTNPHIEYVYKLYWGAFKSIRAFPAIKTHEDNLEFCQLLQNLLEDGLLVLPRLAQGIGESARFYQNPEQKDLDLFLNRILRSYVSRRVIAEQHLALTEACEHQWDLHTGFGDGYVGIIFVHCSASDILKRAQQLVFQNVHRYHTGDNVCQMIPPKIDVAIQNNTPINESQNGEILFAYVPEQLERILYELLDNAVRFTMLKHPDGNYPPIKVTVSANESDVYFRVSDQGGGISSQRFEQLWSYQSRSQMGEFNEMKQVSKVPVAIDDRVSQASEMGHRHLGLGLTMSRIYAEYWGGELQVIPMDGFGTDAYVRIPRLGTNAENLGISHQSEHPDFYDNVKSKYTIYNSSKVPKQHNKKRPLATSEKSKHSNAASIVRTNDVLARKQVLSSVASKSTLPKQQHLYNNMLTHSYNGNGWSESRMIRS